MSHDMAQFITIGVMGILFWTLFLVVTNGSDRQEESHYEKWRKGKL